MITIDFYFCLLSLYHVYLIFIVFVFVVLFIRTWLYHASDGIVLCIIINKYMYTLFIRRQLVQIFVSILWYMPVL